MARVLIIGASRGIGLGLVREYAARGFEVTGTVRTPTMSGPLEAVARAEPDRVRIETVDTTSDASAAL